MMPRSLSVISATCLPWQRAARVRSEPAVMDGGYGTSCSTPHDWKFNSQKFAKSGHTESGVPKGEGEAGEIAQTFMKVIRDIHIGRDSAPPGEIAPADKRKLPHKNSGTNRPNRKHEAEARSYLKWQPHQWQLLTDKDKAK
jgi:hypothetical protein